jgi:hypothetical protein
MSGRWTLLAVLTGVLGGCGMGSSAPPALAYRLPAEREVRYEVVDTAVISIEALGQRLALDVGSAAEYAMTFDRAGDGIRVTLRVVELSATMNVPMAGPVTFDESSISGDLVFTVDRRGGVAVVATPEVDAAVRQLVPPEQVAHSFFPALPGTAVALGGTWVDTLAYEAEGGAQRTISSYVVVGDTVVDGRSLLRIDFHGTAEMEQALSMQGTQVQQKTNLALEGHVLWDQQRGLIYERETRMSGTGTVRMPLLPTELPTRLEMRSRARLASE